MTTILIADDEPAILDLVRFTLEDPQVRIVEAADGAAALRLARETRPERQPDSAAETRAEARLP